MHWVNRNYEGVPAIREKEIEAGVAAEEEASVEVPEADINKLYHPQTKDRT